MVGFGAIAGVGLQNKYSIVIFASALIAGLLLTRQRKILFTPWILAGGAIAFLIFLPNLIWNIQNHWPFLELMHNVRATGKDVVLPPGQYLLQQVLMMNPVSFPFWFGGLLFFFFSRDAKSYRAFGWAFVITIAFFMITHGKDYYSAPAYVMLFAAGAVATERLLIAKLFSASKLQGDLETGLFRLADAWRRAFAAAGFAGAADRYVSSLPIVIFLSKFRRLSELCRRDAAAVLRRRISMAGHGRGGRSRLSFADA